MKTVIACLKAVFGLSVAIIISTSFSGCQKEITGSITDSVTLPDTLPHNLSSKVKTYTETVTSATSGNHSETFTLSYDSQDRLISMVAASSPGDKLLYQYNTDNTYTLDIYNANVINIHETFYLNSLSLVDSSIQSNDTQDTLTEKYIYNSAKQLISLKQHAFSTPPGIIFDITYLYEYDGDGNVTKETNELAVTTYDYYTNLANDLSIGLIYFYRNPNLTKTTSVTSGGNTEISNHAYTFDNLNRLSTETITAASGDVVVKSYTYY